MEYSQKCQRYCRQIQSGPERLLRICDKRQLDNGIAKKYSKCTHKLMDCAGLCLEQADVVLLVDNSATISSTKYRQLLNFIVNVVAELDVDDGKVRIAVITFSDTPTVQFQLSRYRTRLDVINAIRLLPYSGYETDTAAALRLLRNDLFK